MLFHFSIYSSSIVQYSICSLQLCNIRIPIFNIYILHPQCVIVIINIVLHTCNVHLSSCHVVLPRCINYCPHAISLLPLPGEQHIMLHTIIIDREVTLSQSCNCSGRGVFFFFFFPPLRLTHATAKSSDSIIFKFLVFIQQ